MYSTQILVKVKNKGDRTSFWGQHKSLHGAYYQQECQPHGGEQRNFLGGEVMEVVMGIIVLNN